MVPDTVPVGKGYALLLTPAEPVFNRLAREIPRLSRELFNPPGLTPTLLCLAESCCRKRKRW
jgi:hypothetical protein